MKNIEKYEEEIRNAFIEQTSIGCTTKKSREGSCNDERDCNTCCLKSFNWLLKKYKEPPKPILTDEEKIIIKDIIKAFEPFGKELSYITKKRWQSGNRCYLKFEYENDSFGTLTFITDKSFKGMGINQGYTLEELGL